MKFCKKTRHSPRFQGVVAFIITSYVKFVWMTSRWDFVGKEYAEPRCQNNEPMIVCFWHGRLIMMFMAWLGVHRLHMLSSTHPDGEIIGKVIENFGFVSILGSSTKGGKRASFAMLRALKGGESAGITPDGPRGPRYEVSPGILLLARHAKVPILPCTYSTTRGMFLKTWDRFLLPFPFGKGVFMYAPMMDVVNSSKSDEELRQELEATLRELTQKADAYCGRVTP